MGGVFPNGGADVARTLGDWATGGVYGVIMDLRSAGGGNLDAIDSIAGAVGAGEPAQYQIKDGRGETVESPSWVAKPLMLLVDKSTTDGSELLAALLKTCPGVMLLGTPTAGDASVREILRLSETHSLYMRTRRAVVPGGTPYDSKGVQPDVVVEKSDRAVSVTGSGDADRKQSTKARMDAKLMERVAKDAVLARATDILLGLKALDHHGSEAATNLTGSAGM